MDQLLYIVKLTSVVHNTRYPLGAFVTNMWQQTQNLHGPATWAERSCDASTTALLGSGAAHSGQTPACKHYQT